jgi:hypothetical protein
MNGERHRYQQRYLMADGSYQTVTVYAWNKSDADALARAELAGRVGEEVARKAWAYGVERVR